MRIHIGRISPALAERIGELEQRLDRYGERTSPLTLHRKEFGDFYFAFVDMNLDQRQYGKLRTGLNGLMFRQSKLEIKEALPRYTENMVIGAHDELKPNPEQIKRSRSAAPRRIDVYPARERASKHIREEPTFRVRIKGELRKPKMRKRKLWGIEKKPLAKLTHHFVDGEWRDAEDKAVEIVASLHDEHAQARRIAEDVASKSAYLSDSDFEDFKETAKDIGVADSDDGIELVPRDFDSARDRFVRNDDSMSDIETTPQPSNTTSDLGAANTTEALRNALGAEAPFTLFGGPDPESEPEPLVPPVGPIPDTVPAEPRKMGLFFVHTESPYLRTQSMVAKLVGDFDAKAWEAEFYEHRGEWNRSLRKRRRDATRMARRMGKKRGE